MKAWACGGISYLIHHEHQCMRRWLLHWPRFWSEKNQNGAISPTRMGREQKRRDQLSCLMLLRPRQCMSSNSNAGNFSFSGKSQKLSALRTLQEMEKKRVYIYLPSVTHTELHWIQSYLKPLLPLWNFWVNWVLCYQSQLECLPVTHK